MDLAKNVNKFYDETFENMKAFMDEQIQIVKAKTKRSSERLLMLNSILKKSFDMQKQMLEDILNETKRLVESRSIEQEKAQEHGKSKTDPAEETKPSNDNANS